jgi:signal peptidase I
MLLLSKFKIIGHSMEPGFKTNEKVLVSGLVYLFNAPQINDIVAFRKKNKVFIKRIIRINNEKYFLEGDNKLDSIDSWKLGWISKKEILGKVIYKLK